MSNSITVGFSNAGTSQHYVLENQSFANQLGVSTVLASSSVTDNVSGGALSDPYYVPETEWSIPGGFVEAEFFNKFGSTDEAFFFRAEGWNKVKDVSIVAEGDALINMTVDNFVHADLDFSNVDNEVTLNILDGKRGNYKTGDYNDKIRISSATNDSGWSNKHVVDSGAGDDVIVVFKGDNSLIYSTIVNYTDGHLTTFDVRMGSGNDVFYSAVGFSSMDYVHGDDGNDIIASGGGNDKIFGDAGNDVLIGGEDTGQINEIAENEYELINNEYELINYGDILSGGVGSDVFYWQPGDGFDYITDFSESDVLIIDSEDFVETAVATVHTDSGDFTGLMISVNNIESLFLQDYFNDTDIFA
ncbi:MAG: hypothetical protein O2970_11310 [Proteobacteria bacterium]|nr:hypothetical protein [Pseudomonadota bacterium]